ncbi:hypothetical protein THAOC_21644, partial [Thalassiosira oceanica]
MGPPAFNGATDQTLAGVSITDLNRQRPGWFLEGNSRTEKDWIEVIDWGTRHRGTVENGASRGKGAGNAQQMGEDEGIVGPDDFPSKAWQASLHGDSV